jgi:hypothetical protein
VRCRDAEDDFRHPVPPSARGGPEFLAKPYRPARERVNRRGMPVRPIKSWLVWRRAYPAAARSCFTCFIRSRSGVANVAQR